MRFLEISVACDDILQSLVHYRALGFAELLTGDAWDHPYAVVSDGRICIGLHNREMASPALSFVLPGLANALTSGLGDTLKSDYVYTGEEQFHRAGFSDPCGHPFVLLEARTFSPPNMPDTGSSLLGYFDGYALPCAHLAASVKCWESLGFVALEEQEKPYPQVILTSDNLNLILHQNQQLREPALIYRDEGLAKRVALISQRNLVFEREPFSETLHAPMAWIRGPEGLLTVLIEAGQS